MWSQKMRQRGHRRVTHLNAVLVAAEVVPALSVSSEEEDLVLHAWRRCRLQLLDTTLEVGPAFRTLVEHAEALIALDVSLGLFRRAPLHSIDAHNIRLELDILVAVVLQEEAGDDVVLELAFRDVERRRSLGAAGLGAGDGRVVHLMNRHVAVECWCGGERRELLGHR